MGNRRRLRVLHVVASLAPRYGGPAKACPELCRELARQGIDVAIFTTNVDGGRELDVPLGRPVWQDGVEVRYFGVQKPRHYRFSLAFARALKESVAAYDIVHIHSLYIFPSTMAGYYCRRYGIPYIVRPHGTLDPYHFRRHRLRKSIYELIFEWRNLNRAAAIHFTSAGEKELALRLPLKAHAVVVPLGVEPREFARPVAVGAFQREWPETEGKRLVLFLGRLHPKKGLDLLVEAYAIVARRMDNVHLVLAGPDDDGYGREVRRWLVQAGVAEKATFTGMLLGERKLEAMQAAALFILPSYTENFGLAVVEAMASGLPVVISNRVNIWQEVASAQAGLVTGCNAGEVANAILRLLGDCSLGKSMGEHGKGLVERSFSWPVVAKQMLDAYREILASQHRSGARSLGRGPSRLETEAAESGGGG